MHRVTVHCEREEEEEEEEQEVVEGKGREGRTMRAFSWDRIANLARPIEHSVEPILLIGVDVNDSRYLPSVLIDSANRTSGIRLDGAICQRQMRRLHAPARRIYTCERYLIRTRSALPLHHPRRSVAPNEKSGKLGVRGVCD